jgi:hypothetical protein
LQQSLIFTNYCIDLAIACASWHYTKLLFTWLKRKKTVHSDNVNATNEQIRKGEQDKTAETHARVSSGIDLLLNCSICES